MHGSLGLFFKFKDKKKKKKEKKNKKMTIIDQWSIEDLSLISSCNRFILFKMKILILVLIFFHLWI